jgi:peroxiredoxin Q/BCP
VSDRDLEKSQEAGRSGRAPRMNRSLRVGGTASAVVGVAVIALGVIFFLNGQGGSAGEQASVGSGGAQANGGASGGEYPYQVGDPGPGEAAPPIKLPSTDGGEFDLASTRGETTLLYFHGGVMCQPCYDQITDIEAQWGKFEELGIDNFVSITHDPLNASKQAAESMDLSSPVLYDENLEVSKTYDANKYGMMGGSANGHTFIVVGPEGEIQWRSDYGGAPEYTMYMPVKALLADMRAGFDGGKGGVDR